jgi:hypothetical protein
MHELWHRKSSFALQLVKDCLQHTLHVILGCFKLSNSKWIHSSLISKFVRFEIAVDLILNDLETLRLIVVKLSFEILILLLQLIHIRLISARTLSKFDDESIEPL